MTREGMIGLPSEARATCVAGMPARDEPRMSWLTIVFKSGKPRLGKKYRYHLGEG
jgi:hypothetical protein